MNFFEKIGAHIVLWLICSLLVINVCFLIGININAWSLLLSYFVYLDLLVIYKISKKQNITKRGIWFAIILPLIFLIATFYFGKTYDSSFDGQDYHSSAVIELVNGWNPWKTTILPMKLPDATSYVIGYPKSLWLIQAEIYAFTKNLNSATATNFLILIPAFIFVFSALNKFKLSRLWTIFLTIMIIFEPNFIQQYFTFMEDGFSYQLSLIVIANLILLIKLKNKELPLAVLLSSIILLVGTKFSNLPMAGVASFISIVYLIKLLIKSPRLIIMYETFLIFALIILWVPYVFNFIHFGTPLYPSNKYFVKRDLVQQNIPNNLKNANRAILLFYGIYSEGQQAESYNSPDNLAILKIPFSTSLKEIGVTNDFNERVGSEGVLFSGLFSVSFLLYVYFLLRYKSFFHNRIRFLILSACLIIVVIVSLSEPTPNVLRYESVIYLVPVFILITLISSKIYKDSYATRMMGILLGGLILLNIFIKYIPTIYARDHEMKAENYLLESMKNSHKTFIVHSDSFYSSYIILQEHNVTFKKTDKLTCKNPHAMWTMFATYYCKE
ncbi:MAG: hypothetical protein ACREHC_01930 [Candidatus Levyibacteriota bacterium]